MRKVLTEDLLSFQEILKFIDVVYYYYYYYYYCYYYFDVTRSIVNG